MSPSDAPAPTGAIRIDRYGEAAWLVSFAIGASTVTARQAHALARAVIDPTRDAPPPIAGIASVLVRFDPLADDGSVTRRAIEDALEQLPADPPADPAARTHEIAVRYGGTDGPDLETVAGELGLNAEDVVDRHAAVTYEVLMLGFAPGFAYLGDLDPALHVPRLATPRPRVPAGSVAIADAFTGTYPAALPGGWRLIGRTDRTLFDPRAPEPALLRPGDRVRFVPER